MRTAALSKGSPWWKDLALRARITLDRHAQRAREGLEHGLALVVGVVAAQVVDVQRHLRVMTKPWKNSCTRSTSNSPIRPRVNFTWYSSPGRAGEVDHRARQGLVEGT